MIYRFWCWLTGSCDPWMEAVDWWTQREARRKGDGE